MVSIKECRHIYNMLESKNEKAIRLGVSWVQVQKKRDLPHIHMVFNTFNIEKGSK